VAQTAAVMMGSSAPAEAMESALLAAVNRFKFFKPVLPGTQLRIETAVLTRAGTMACIEGTVSAAGEKVASGELSIVSGPCVSGR